ncbi:alkaline phosphatase D family protein [Croceicoccus bisphenolivorans]|uniref:alkaline phosphatase D family protein n=1 Tax=Croceicoccus bisphenolivorans TaxID=1783232 RepID=UPI000833C684|nr:alkaline phosphatase D family protein [Croceicoccus bisphenolivorans]
MSPFTANRRRVLAGLAASSALATMPFRVRAHDIAVNPAFRHGVASGDPDATSVVLWTRVTAEGQRQVGWEVARDIDFAEIVQEGTVETGPERDHTVKVLADALKPGETYYYRFTMDAAKSATGRTRTLPTGHVERLGIALASCSNYPFGFFNAYEAIARDPAIDFVLHTGDYIYEYGADGWGAEIARVIGRVHQPAHEIVSLSDYRQRHAQYKTDHGSQAMLAAHPLLACWDDHESANNPWTGGAQNHQSEAEGDWNARRVASIRAYYEWMPVREPEWLAVKGRNQMQFWRAYSFGDLAMLHTLETRHTARAEQIDYMAWADKVKTDADARHLVDNVIGAPGRTMLASALEDDLSAALSASVKAGQPWRLIGNPMPIAETRVPDVVALGLVPDPVANPDISDAAKALAWKGKWNLPFYTDTWDGYLWAKERLYKLSRDAGAGDLIFLTGDSHSFWLNDLIDAAGQPAGIEIGTAGISSPGDFMESGFGPKISPRLDKAFADHNPQVVWTDNMHQGYVRVELTHQSGEAVFIGVDTVLDPRYRTFEIRRATMLRSDDGLTLA